MTEAVQDIRPGAALGAERNSRDWSIEYVCDQINLSKSVVKALEADDYVSLPPAAFVRGYIRSYAKLLEIESDTLVVKYEQLEMPVADVVPLVETESSVTSDPLIRMVSGLVVAIVIGVLAYWWYNNRFAEEAEVAEVPVSSTPPAVDLEPTNNIEPVPEKLFKSVEQDNTAGTALAPGVSYEKPVNFSDNNPNALPAVEVPVASVLKNNPVIKQLSDETVEITNTPESIQEAVELTENSAAGTTAAATNVGENKQSVELASSGSVDDSGENQVQGTDILLLKTESESWVSVIDAAEIRLMYGILTSGTPRKLQGVAPFSVVLGAAPGIEATLNGSIVDFSPLIRKSNTARFVIEQTGEAHR